MTVRSILSLGDPGLRLVAPPVDPDAIASDTIQDLVRDLIQTMRHANGAGLAATQIGVLHRVVALEVEDNPRYPYKPRIPLTVAINPVLEPLSDETFDNYEGCLSVPGLRGVVQRHRHLRVRWHDPDGNAHDEVVEGLTAGTWQHECDHLDGKLFVDRVRDPHTLTTWDNFKRFHEEAFVARVRQLHPDT